MLMLFIAYILSGSYPHPKGCELATALSVNGSHSMWVPSVNDCLSNDWAIVK